MNQIASLTKDCEREDCRVAYHGSSMTLLGWTQSYDKQGRPVARDPNTTTSAYSCGVCGKRWTIKSRAGE